MLFHNHIPLKDQHINKDRICPLTNISYVIYYNTFAEFDEEANRTATSKNCRNYFLPSL
jgi:hypothetical protein